jgi:hypothetical protein
MAKDNHCEFFSFPATYMMYENIVSGEYPPYDKLILSRLPETPEQNIARFKKKPKSTDYCLMQSKQVTLDSYGRMYLCQMMYNSKTGDYLKVPLKDLRRQILASEFCPKCKASGVPMYARCYGDPIVWDNPVEEANKGKYK